MKKDISTIILVILGIIAFIFILPWIAFWLAYFGGWITKILIGKQLVNGFALIGITLPIEKIPLLAGTLGWIGGFFKAINTNYKYNKD